VATVKKRKINNTNPSKKRKTSKPSRVLCDNITQKKEQQPKTKEEQSQIQTKEPVVLDKENRTPSCTHCQTKDTPMWRKGPLGLRT
jgi:hypothetical protein